MAAVDAVETYLDGLPALKARRLAHGEWGLTIPGDEPAASRWTWGCGSPTACCA